MEAKRDLFSPPYSKGQKPSSLNATVSHLAVLMRRRGLCRLNTIGSQGYIVRGKKSAKPKCECLSSYHLIEGCVLCQLNAIDSALSTL